MTGQTLQPPTIFIVDDDPPVRDALCTVVRVLGHAVRCFSSGDELLAFVTAEDSPRPTCVIADVQMPGMGGIELHRKLMAAGKPFPMIMITGHENAGMRRRAEELGLVAFLEKPFRSEELQAAIESTLNWDVDD